jgi:hypothetical protein
MPSARPGASPKRGKKWSLSRARSAGSKGDGAWVTAPVYHAGHDPKPGRTDCHENDPSDAHRPAVADRVELAVDPLQSHHQGKATTSTNSHIASNASEESTSIPQAAETPRYPEWSR